jgi:hypothetical protein
MILKLEIANITTILIVNDEKIRRWFAASKHMHILFYNGFCSGSV